MEDLPTLREIFVNGSLAPEPLYGPFGACYVAFAGSHDVRYRGEKLLEIAAKQFAAATAAQSALVPQCLFTDQPERKRAYLQLQLPLRTSLDSAPFVDKCEEYTRLFNRPCKLLFGYMAKVGENLAVSPLVSCEACRSCQGCCSQSPFLLLRAGHRCCTCALLNDNLP